VHFFHGSQDDQVSGSDLKEFLNKKIYDLSGGQQQRYWLARILFNRGNENSAAGDPGLLVLDESIASLDCITKNLIIALLLEEVLSRRGMTILFVSHDLRDINVIYKTLLENAGAENIHNIFEHYEMFHKSFDKNDSDREYIYRVKTPFPEYCENLINRKPNTYISPRNNKELHLRLKTAADGKGNENEFETK
jgi:ABC-type nitrate/sulfonate/bicarbonate transport system ATPase subunit